MSIEINSLHIEYPGHLVFQNVDLAIGDNEIVAIETQVLDGGTSLLKGIAGFLNGVAGSVMLDGFDLLRDPPESVLARVGFVYEDHGLVSLYSVFQNIALPLQFHTDLTPEEINEAVTDMCERVGIDEELLGLRPHRLNDVQTRLVNVARALVVNPGVLLIDELEGGMSDDILRDTMTTLRQHQQQHPMAVIITTSSELVMSHADRVFLIEDFRLVERVAA